MLPNDPLIHPTRLKMKKDLVRHYMDLSVSSATLRTYAIRIAALKKFLSERVQQILTLELFAEFLRELESKNGHAAKSTAEGYRSALCHHQRVHGLWATRGSWADSWECRKMVAGWAYKGRAVPATSRPARGQVDAPMFEDMMTEAKKSFPRFAPALEIAYRTALRPSQLMSLRQGCFVGGYITVPDKRCRASNKFPPSTRKAVIDPAASNLLLQLDKTPGPYFDFSLFELRTVFKKIGQTLQWNSDQLKFDGPHCLRHGGMSHLSDLLGDEAESKKEELLQVSNNTKMRYTKPNSRRGT
jgi:hypothetical protein